MRRTVSERGGALLAVLWISAALAAIAFSVSATVRTEQERAGTFSDSVRTHFLATGAIERARLYVAWVDYANPDGSPRYFQPGTARLNFAFPTGAATVEIVPETAKLSLNTGRPEEILRVLINLNIEPARAQELAAGIVDWRSPVPGGFTLFDQHYLSLSPSFRARHASFQQTEELLLVKGVTPELFYGRAIRGDGGQLVPVPGLRDVFSAYGSELMIDVNHAEPPVLGAIGVPPGAMAEILQRRAVRPFRSPVEFGQLSNPVGDAGRRLMIGGSSIFTFRATARLRLPDGRLSDMSRSVSAMLKFHQKPVNAPPVEVLRWYDY